MQETIMDRRSGDERRASRRFPITLDIEWEAGGERRTGTLSDVSHDGCFVLSSGDVSDGADVRIFVPLADGMKVQFAGRVANHVFEIGFGVKFDMLSDPQRELLANLIEQNPSAAA